jgi:[acyl-carrier-protein] S-malonyltransferase
MKKVAFLFPGQGAQYVGMSKKICEMFPAAEQTFEEANDLLGFNLQKLCFEGSMEELTKTENTQPAILTASVAAFRVYMQEIGIAPEYTVGHSLGEISALCCSGAIEFCDAVRLVRQRGKFMQEAVPLGLGIMAAVSGIEQSEIEEECRRVSDNGKTVVVSNYNSKAQIVISGHVESVKAVETNLKEKGASVIILRVSAPFHSPLMKPAADNFKEELNKYSYKDFKWPVLSNVTALPYGQKENIIDNLTNQIVQPVRWQESMEYLHKHGVNLAVEMGPKTVLKNLMKGNIPGLKTLSYDVETDMEDVKRELTGTQQLPGTGMDVITKCIAIAVCTKNHNFNNDEYQKGVVENYRKIQSMKDELVKETAEPTVGQMKEALSLLRTIFITKKTPAEEQTERFNEIFDNTGTRELVSNFKI